MRIMSLQGQWVNRHKNINSYVIWVSAIRQIASRQNESCRGPGRCGRSTGLLNSWAIAVPITISWYMLVAAKIISVLQSVTKTLSREQCLFQQWESSLVVKWMIYTWGLDTILQSGPVFPALIDDTCLISTLLLRPHQCDRGGSGYGKPLVLELPSKLCERQVRLFCTWAPTLCK